MGFDERPVWCEGKGWEGAGKSWDKRWRNKPGKGKGKGETREREGEREREREREGERGRGGGKGDEMRGVCSERDGESETFTSKFGDQ